MAQIRNKRLKYSKIHLDRRRVTEPILLRVTAVLSVLSEDTLADLDRDIYFDVGLARSRHHYYLTCEPSAAPPDFSNAERPVRHSRMGGIYCVSRNVLAMKFASKTYGEMGDDRGCRLLSYLGLGSAHAQSGYNIHASGNLRVCDLSRSLKSRDLDERSLGKPGHMRQAVREADMTS
jgi:hypothetical protein